LRQLVPYDRFSISKTNKVGFSAHRCKGCRDEGWPVNGPKPLASKGSLHTAGGVSSSTALVVNQLF